MSTINIIFIIIGIVLAILIILWLVRKYNSNSYPNSFFQDMDPNYNIDADQKNENILTNSNTNADNINEDPNNRYYPNTVYNFYTDKCIYCKSFEPIWNQLVKYFDGSDNIKLVPINVNNPLNHNITTYYNVKTFPTIIIVTPDSTYEYEGYRTFENVYQFIINNSK